MTLPIDRLVLRFNLTYTLACEFSCYAIIYENNTFLRFYFFGTMASDSIIITKTSATVANISILFHTTSQTLNDQMIIYDFSLEGVAGAGAPSCVSCLPGTYSSDLSNQCLYCPTGTQSNGTACNSCPAGTFNDQVGGACTACGAGTTSTIGSTFCSTNCVFSNANGNTWDLSPLTRNDYYSPFVDNKNQSYFINVCSIQHNRSLCVDLNGNPINTSVCQFAANNVWYDTGHILSVAPSANLSGIDLTYNYGAPCRGRNRTTVLHFICDLTAGAGTFQGLNGVVENPQCYYQLSWR